MTVRRTVSEPVVELVAAGDIPEAVRARARHKVAGLARYASEPVLHARVRLTRSHDPAVDRPIMAQGNLDVNGRPVRAQVAAATPYEAVDLLVARLRRRLHRIARHWQARRGVVSGVDAREWRHHSDAAPRPGYHPRPEAEREIMRRKTFGPALATVDEAVFDMDQLDYDFYLFTDADSGRDSVVYRAGPSGHRLAQVGSDPIRVPATAVPLTVSAHPAPLLTVAEARRRLDVTGLPFLFYAEPADGRGRILYRRYDGHYGLIQPG